MESGKNNLKFAFPSATVNFSLFPGPSILETLKNKCQKKFRIRVHEILQELMGLQQVERKELLFEEVKGAGVRAGGRQWGTV